MKWWPVRGIGAAIPRLRPTRTHFMMAFFPRHSTPAPGK